VKPPPPDFFPEQTAWQRFAEWLYDWPAGIASLLLAIAIFVSLFILVGYLGNLLVYWLVPG
jgi:hypothetical protein